MELDAAVIRPSKASAPQTDRRHAKVASILLHQHVRGNFGSAKEGVLALIDLKVSAMPCSNGVGIVPARGGLPQVDGIRSVAVDFVGGEMDKRDLGL